MATVFTDSDQFPSFADRPSDSAYARLMRSRAEVARGYDDAELARWVQRARAWIGGGSPGDLPRISQDPDPPATKRDVFVCFISAAKQRNPAAAMALPGLLAD